MPKMLNMTFLEWLIIGTIIAILAAVILPAVGVGPEPKPPSVTSCISGYTFTNRGVQVMDSQGHGIPCS